MSGVLGATDDEVLQMELERALTSLRNSYYLSKDEILMIVRSLASRNTSCKYVDKLEAVKSAYADGESVIKSWRTRWFIAGSPPGR